MDDFDDIVIGAGMAGLATAALLGKKGRKVLVLEAHDVPGGYAHTFRVRDFRFCAQVHYIFGCGEGETIDSFLHEIGIGSEVPFLRLDPEGFDHVVVSGKRVRVPNGLRKFEQRLLRLHPEARSPITRYFQAIEAVARELDDDAVLPKSISPLTLARAAVRFRHLLYHRKHTLADVYDQVGMPAHLRAVLAGQSGDYLLPPEQVSFLLHVALVHGYDRGAYYPKKHFFHMVETIAKRAASYPGCAVRLNETVDRIHVEGNRAVGVTTKNGAKFAAKRVISNIDPKLTHALIDRRHVSRKDERRAEYAYSCSTFTIYLAVKGLDLREHGFGSHNVWHYPHSDIGKMYEAQLAKNDLRDPWLFMSTPSLHSDEPGICPPDHQILEIATACDYEHFAGLRARDRRAYNLEKKKVRDHIIDIVTSTYVPKLRDRLVLRVTGTPATNERYCRAPKGNAYGAELSPAHVTLDRRPHRTSIENLYLANATAGMPSVAGAIGAGVRLVREIDER